MLSILNVPFPCEYGSSERILTSALVGAFVTLFLFLFQPFGIDEVSNGMTASYIGFGIVTFLCLLFIYIVVPRIFPNYFAESTYTLGKEIIVGGAIVLLIGLTNSIYLILFLGKFLGGFGVFTMIWQTFLVGIFPFTLITLLNYNKLLKSNLKASNEIIVTAPTSSPALKTKEKHPSHEIILEENKASVSLTNLAYIESIGNYVNVTVSDNGEMKQNLYRSTLKSIVEETQLAHIIRCHRSYIVNLSKVTAVSGNAQGLRLSLKDCDQEIPVSRKYIPEVKNYFAQVPHTLN